MLGHGDMGTVVPQNHAQKIRIANLNILRGVRSLHYECVIYIYIGWVRYEVVKGGQLYMCMCCCV